MKQREKERKKKNNDEEKKRETGEPGKKDLSREKAILERRNECRCDSV